MNEDLKKGITRVNYMLIVFIIVLTVIYIFNK